MSLTTAEGATILDHVSASVPASGITVLAGPSGAGKTTLLRLCNRLEVPSSGRVLFHGDDVAGLDPLSHRRRVGMVFQRPTLFPGTIRDNLAVADPDAGDERYSRSSRRPRSTRRSSIAGGTTSPVARRSGPASPGPC